MPSLQLDPIYALVDCNNFYCSCERVFNPALEKKPMAVLSNNDGCIVARSNEIKALGIPMGAPMFQYKKLLEQKKAVILSSNYQLYGDMSQRVMTTLRQFTPAMEVYSIDEAFLRLEEFRRLDLDKYSLEIRKTIKQWTGIPVSIGIAPNKTRAKVANHMAKKHTKSGVFNICKKTTQNDFFGNFIAKFSDDFRINLGGRLNNNFNYGSQFTYSINPSWRLINGNDYSLKIHSALSTAFIAPSLYQLFDPYSGNIDLKPEENSSFEAGLNFNNKKWSFTSNYFSRLETPSLVYDLVTPSIPNLKHKLLISLYCHYQTL